MNGRSDRLHRLRVVGWIAVVATLVGVTAATASAATGSRGVVTRAESALQGPQRDVRYAIERPLCATQAAPGHVTCYAMRRVTVAAGTPGARPYVADATPGLGPAGGYTPDDLAIAYDFNPAVARSSQTVAVVNWYDDPHIAQDLGAFDSHYGLPAETSTSFRKVNQTGAKSPLPSTSSGTHTAGETAMDVESVRSVCHTCHILLVEATTSAKANIAAAELTAVRLGATEVSNSFGSSEGGESSAMLAAFDQPGVVITAATGDDGWFFWDNANNTSGASGEAPAFPASDPHVVSVGGTSLALNNDASIALQEVWNENGADDQAGLTAGAALGAGGGGCSTEFTAPAWQSSYPGYASADCGGKRLSADVSMVSDPETGFDIYDTWGTGDTGWLTAGGTSLASPIVAAMWALAGGPGQAVYPAKSLYENALHQPTLVYDVTQGGNGFCGGASTLDCGNAAFDDFGGTTHNPNGLGAGDVDCSFARNPDPTDPVSAPAASSECNATVGFDGPTGVGTPNGAALFASTSPTASVTHSKTLSLHKPASFVAHATERLTGASVTTYEFVWGDGKHTSSHSATIAHTYTKKGTYRVELLVTDNAGQQSLARSTVTVGKALTLKFSRPSKVKHHHKAAFHARGTDPNTGGVVKKITWHWGDGHTSTGASAKHTWKKAGTYTVKITLHDNTGVTTTFTKKIKVG